MYSVLAAFCEHFNEVYADDDADDDDDDDDLQSCIFLSVIYFPPADSWGVYLGGVWYDVRACVRL